MGSSQAADSGVALPARRLRRVVARVFPAQSGALARFVATAMRLAGTAASRLMLLRYAHDHGFDLVVAGYHRQTRAGRLLIHGLAERLIAAGSIPLLVVSEDETR